VLEKMIIYYLFLFFSFSCKSIVNTFMNNVEKSVDKSKKIKYLNYKMIFFDIIYIDGNHESLKGL